MKEERKKYERPSMKRSLVELEDGFCVASADIENGSTQQAGIKSHSVNEGFEVDFSSGSWD